MFDLGQLAALSSSPDNVLVVSDRTLYLLQNLSTTSIEDRHNYATDFSASGYHYLQDDEGEAYDLYSSVYRAAWLELIPVKPYSIVETIVAAGSQELAAGLNTFWLHTVPAGKIHEVNSLGINLFGTMPTAILWQMRDGEQVASPILAGLPLAIGYWHPTLIRLAVSQLFQIGIVVLGATEGDTLYWAIQYSVLGA